MFNQHEVLRQASEFIRENAINPKKSFDFSVIADSKWHRIGSSESYIASLQNNGLSITYKNYAHGNIHKFIRSNGYDSIKFTSQKSLSVKKTTKLSISPFAHNLKIYSAISNLTPQRANLTPYFRHKLKSHDDLLALGVKEAYFYKGKIYQNPSRGSIPVAVLPLKNLQGDITGFQFFSNNKDLDADKTTNKIIIGKKQGSFAFIGKALKDSTRQFVGEGAATVLSAKSFIDFNPNTDCLIIGIDSGNLKEIVKNNKDLLTNTFFIADNDVIDTSKPYSKNTGLLTAIECLYELELQNEKNIYVPISQNGQKIDFNDLEFQENHLFELLSAIDVISKYPLLSQKDKDKTTLKLNNQLFVIHKEGGEKSYSVKDLIYTLLFDDNNRAKIFSSVIEKNNNRGEQDKFDLIFNGQDFFLLKKSNNLVILTLPLINYFIEKSNNLTSTKVKGLLNSPILKGVVSEIILNAIKTHDRDTLAQLNFNSQIKMLCYSSDVLKNGKYLPDISAKIDFNTIYLVNSLGTGKSYFISNKINDFKTLYGENTPILSINPLISLTAHASNLFDLTYYKKNQHSSNQLATTLNSLNKEIDFFLEEFNKKKGLLIFDEVIKIFSMFNSGILDCNTTKLFNKLIKLIELAHTVIYADANLKYHKQLFDFLTLLRDSNDSIIIDAEILHTHNKKVYSFESFDTLVSNARMDLKNNNRLMFGCSSEKKAVEIYHVLKNEFLTKKGLLITANHKNEDNAVMFLANPNQEMGNYDYIIYSPTITSGVSFDDLKNTPDFKQYFYFSNNVLNPFDALQMTGRFRRKMDLNICFKHNFAYGNLLKEDDYFLNNHALLLELISSFETTKNDLDPQRKTFIWEVLRQAIDKQELNEFDKFIINEKHQDSFLKENFACIFRQLLIDNGYQIIDANQIYSTESKELLDVARETIFTNEVERILTANELTELEFNSIKNSEAQNLQQQAEKQQYEIKNFFGLDINQENIEYVVKNKTTVRATSRRALIFTNEEYLASKSLKQFDSERDSFKPKTAIKNHIFISKFYKLLLKCAGVEITKTGLIPPDNAHIELKQFGELFNFVKKHRQFFEINGLGKIRGDFDKSLKWVVSQLTFFGFGYSSKTRNLTLNDPMINHIAINYTRLKWGVGCLDKKSLYSVELSRKNDQNDF